MIVVSYAGRGCTHDDREPSCSTRRGAHEDCARDVQAWEIAFSLRGRGEVRENNLAAREDGRSAKNEPVIARRRGVC